MCGIVGYVGPNPAIDFLLAGLQRLEYRGYDSAGVAALADGRLQVVKTAGRLANLEAALQETPLTGNVGIGHTRWATHGPASQKNAHPHLGGEGEVAVVHNGVIENHSSLRARLTAAGYLFHSETDTEVIGHLLAEAIKSTPRNFSQDSSATNGDNHERTNPTSAHVPPEVQDWALTVVKKAIACLTGAYGLAILFRDAPGLLVAARCGSPLVLGVGEGEHYLASDASPLAGRVEQIVYLADHEIALLTATSLRVAHQESGHVEHRLGPIPVQPGEVDRGGFDHYMLKEIFEQPESLRNTMRGRLDFENATAVFGGLNLTPQQLQGVNKIVLTGCGTSWHSALVGEYMIEEFARIPVEVEYASELRYRNPPMEPGTLLFAITQSGETADTLAALREVKRRGHPTLAICNVVGSTIAQEADGGVYLHAGPEVGVASTKAYTSQVATLMLLALYFGRLRHVGPRTGRRVIEAMRQLPDLAARALETNDAVQRIATKYAECRNFLYLGRQYNFPSALEGALKLKEISYIHAEGYPAAEMKHGPIALIEEDTPSVFLVTRDAVYDKVLANLEEVKARRGPVIAVVEEGDTEAASLADDVIVIPRTPDFLQPIITAIPLQLLAYHIAVLRGCDVDKPRNLAKSVTVE
ncbi:glutamine--fructose-6-phosphate transaminase (isomerizing) [Lignipirellula cremea]|uniref:Glutamine--fructose-6-phosphate aminotransferase [isomerizing] n=1 Tax=Lignipirellula cremea TaxID=2528010 RepID=A0A518DXS4_9BACT|nr:glutamine--fructose-6-phosphate transaminase (isomerizing) [Lignipirellula cremea]QDU96649.1 Glutamine--fructose-6-phosphate aminotransferase [isomerizing] [Lignipirellula cremea]